MYTWLNIFLKPNLYKFAFLTFHLKNTLFILSRIKKNTGKENLALIFPKLFLSILFYPFLPHLLLSVTTVTTKINKNSSNDPWVSNVHNRSFPFHQCNLPKSSFLPGFFCYKLEVKTSSDYSTIISMSEKNHQLFFSSVIAFQEL